MENKVNEHVQTILILSIVGFMLCALFFELGESLGRIIAINR